MEKIFLKFAAEREVKYLDEFSAFLDNQIMAALLASRGFLNLVWSYSNIYNHSTDGVHGVYFLRGGWAGLHKGDYEGSIYTPKPLTLMLLNSVDDNRQT